MVLRIIDVACPICQCPDPQPLGDPLTDVENRVEGRYTIARCQVCQFIFLSRRPDAESLNQCYGQNYYTAVATPKNRFRQFLYALRARARMHRLLRLHGRMPQSLLEVGHGNMEFLKFLGQQFKGRCQLTGTDIKIHAIHAPDPSFNIRLVEGDVGSLNLGQSFETIVMYDVLEHIADPLIALRNLHKHLEPQGSLIGQVPNWNSVWRHGFSRHWSGLQIPRHQNFFTAKTLRSLLEKTGFQLVSVHNVYDPGDLSVSFCNWITDTLKLQTLSRRSWFFIPATLLAAGVVALQVFLLRNSGEIEFKAVPLSSIIK